jgi:hypothetical protein
LGVVEEHCDDGEGAQPVESWGVRQQRRRWWWWCSPFFVPSAGADGWVAKTAYRSPSARRSVATRRAARYVARYSPPYCQRERTIAHGRRPPAIRTAKNRANGCIRERSPGIPGALRVAARYPLAHLCRDRAQATTGYTATRAPCSSPTTTMGRGTRCRRRRSVRLCADCLSGCRTSCTGTQPASPRNDTSRW